jgi:hypothetical protein
MVASAPQIAVTGICAVRLGFPQTFDDHIADLTQCTNVKLEKPGIPSQTIRKAAQEISACPGQLDWTLGTLCSHEFPERLVLLIRETAVKDDLVFAQACILFFDHFNQPYQSGEER